MDMSHLGQCHLTPRQSVAARSTGDVPATIPGTRGACAGSSRMEHRRLHLGAPDRSSGICMCPVIGPLLDRDAI